MKQFLITTIIFLFVIGLQAQTASSSKKWNDLYKRYEYFDSKGQMIGYEKWNNLYDKWEYFESRNYQQPNTSTYSNYEYKSPYDIGLIERALAIKQQRYDQKYNNIQNKINHIWDIAIQKADEGIASDSHYKYMENFNEETKKITSNMITNNYEYVMNWLRDIEINVRSWKAVKSNIVQSQTSKQEQAIQNPPKTEKYPPGLYAVSKGAIINQNPDYNSKILLQMRDGGTVRVIDKVQNTTFYKVEANGTIGYMWVVGFKN